MSVSEQGSQHPDPATPATGSFILRVDSCLTPTEVISDACILCTDGIISAVGGASAFHELQDLPWIRRPGCIAIPGLVDTHIHGTGGYDVMSGGPDISSMSATLASHGVTAFIPTVLSADLPQMLERLEKMAAMCHGEPHGAVPVGIHLEGPYINVQKRGSQAAEFIRPVDEGEARELLEAGRGQVRIMTFAPELERAESLMQLLLSHQVVPSMGHSLADEEAARRAIDIGATRCTHFYNGMPQLTQREVSLPAVVLTDDRVTIELIVDGVHVHPRMIDLACRAKPRNRVVGISDAATGAGLVDGICHFGNDMVQVAEGSCRRVSDGRLAGSCLTLDKAMRNLRQFSPSMSDQEVISCFTLNAARSIGLRDRGQIQPGRRADITVVDQDWNIQMTFAGGRLVYDRTKEENEPAGE
jgi:N-acetylglucosamine-6-phosphate deacetylase